MDHVLKIFSFSYENAIFMVNGDSLFLYVTHTISVIYDSVSKYACINCLCDNSRHAMILLTFSAYMACIYECGPFLKIQSERKVYSNIIPPAEMKVWTKSFFPFSPFLMEPFSVQVKSSENIRFEPSVITK